MKVRKVHDMPEILSTVHVSISVFFTLIQVSIGFSFISSSFFCYTPIENKRVIDKIKTETAVMKRVLSTVESYVNIMVIADWHTIQPIGRSGIECFRS